MRSVCCTVLNFRHFGLCYDNNNFKYKEAGAVWVCHTNEMLSFKISKGFIIYLIKCAFYVTLLSSLWVYDENWRFGRTWCQKILSIFKNKM